METLSHLPSRRSRRWEAGAGTLRRCYLPTQLAFSQAGTMEMVVVGAVERDSSEEAARRKQPHHVVSCVFSWGLLVRKFADARKHSEFLSVSPGSQITVSTSPSAGLWPGWAATRCAVLPDSPAKSTMPLRLPCGLCLCALLTYYSLQFN